MMHLRLRSSGTMVAVLCLIAPAQLRAQTEISWSTVGEQYGYTNGQPTPLLCPPGGTAGRVYGTDIYTDDSSICTAAVHAGLITLAEGGRIILHV
ncbi:MAG: LCCL domain-containing protein, partial [Longimicrobiales bacterium]